MEFPSISYLRLLRNLSEAIRVRESVVEYNNLLQVIFEEKDEEGNTVFITSLSRDHDELSQVIRPDQVFGRNHEKEQLLSRLMYSPNKTLTAAPPSSSSRPQLHVISILGGGGIGKTTLARLVYDDEVVKDNFSLRAWVRLGGQGFSLMHVAKELLKSASGISYLVDDLDELDEMVRDALKLHRCLIVFDEIESITNDSWLHMIRYWFNFVDLGSKVLVTTHSKDVADLVADQTYELTQLSDDAGLSLCIYLADRVEFIHSSRVAENLAALCRGIPLLSKLMGCLMRYDERINNLLSTMDLSNGDLMPFWDESIVILLSIWALPQHLRQCLFFCAAFPKGYPLDKEKIIESWIAHGIIKKNIGDAYLQQLLSRSFFTDVTFNEYGDIAEFQMPDMIHNIAQNVARIVCGERLGLIGSISENASRLSLVSPSAGKYDLEEDLQMLILSSTIYLNDDLDRSLIEFKDLRSLDLSCSGIRSLTDDICALKELRCLNLSYTFIEELPNSITQLSRLQTLDLSWCYHLKVLPERMRDLVDLRRLDLRHCESLSALPSGIGLLISLNSMPLFVVGKDRDSACLDELQTLDQLRGRLEIRNLENVKEITEAQDSKLDQKNIHHLVLFWSENADDCFGILQCLKPNPYLEVLDLSGYMGIEFPPWISSIYGLTKISINNCGSKKLPSLGQLPLLKELQLKGMSNIEYIGWEFYGDGLHDVFPCLENLGFYDMPRLLNWSTAARSRGPALRMFRSLKTLTIEGCHQLPSLPSLPTLTDLIVWNSKTEILSSLTSFKSLSSILVNDVELGSFFEDLSRLKSLKKLILFNIKDVYISSQLFTNIFFALEYLSILHCHQLRAISLSDLRSLQKLHIVDCLELNVMVGPLESKMIEFVIEDCPREFSLDFIYLCPILRKLTVKNCPKVNTSYLKLPQLEGVEYLFIRGCPQLQKRLQMDPSIVSHIPCVMLGDDKVDEASSKDSKDSVNLETEESAVKFSTGDNPSLGLCFSNEESKEFVKFESEDSAQVEISTAPISCRTSIMTSRISTFSEKSLDGSNKVKFAPLLVPKGIAGDADFFPSPEVPNEITNVGDALPCTDKTPVSVSTIQITEQINSTMINAGTKYGIKTTIHKLSRRLWPWAAFLKTAKSSKERDQGNISISAPLSPRTQYMTSRGSTSPDKGVAGSNEMNQLRMFSISELKVATRNFRPDTLLGEGCFGTVYKGWLKEKYDSNPGSGTVVAVKMYPDMWQGNQERQSVVRFLRRLSHPNLVKLFGYCWEDNNLFLVHEFMQKGSLEKHLFGRIPAFHPLSWDIRLKILIGAARGLSFLHALDKITVYRDFKASNILLDGSYNAKLFDFWPPTAKYSHVTTADMGTYGYAAPEYIATGHLYVKSDIYGFGVVLLEMLTGIRAVDLNRLHGTGRSLVNSIRPHLSDRKKLKRMIDLNLEGRYDTGSALQIARLAQTCLEIQPRNRPSSQKVVETLERIDSKRKKRIDSAVVLPRQQ